MKRAAIYIRQSKAKADSISPELQRASTTRLCHEKGYKIVAEFEDIGVTGYRDWRKRPAFPELLEGVESGKYDVIVLHRWNRLGRKPSDALVLLDMIEAAGAKVETALEGGDTVSAFGKFSVRNLLMHAALESDVKSEQFKEAQAKRMSNGLPAHGHARYGYSYVKEPGEVGRYEIDPQSATVVREAWSRYVAGTGWSVIARDLNEAGHRTFAGKAFGINTLQRVLDSGFPAGLIVHNNGAVFDQGSHEAILTPDEWERYQDERKARSRKPARKQSAGWYLTDIVRCGKCGSHMVWKSRSLGNLECAYAKRTRDCEGVNINERYLNSPVGLFLLSHMRDVLAAVDVENRSEAASALRLRVKALRDDLQASKAALGKLAEGWSKGQLDDIGYGVANADARQLHAEIESSLERATAELRDSSPLSPDDLARLDTLGDGSDPASWNRTLKKVLSEIRIDDDAITITPVAGEPVRTERTGKAKGKRRVRQK